MSHRQTKARKRNWVMYQITGMCGQLKTIAGNDCIISKDFDAHLTEVGLHLRAMTAILKEAGKDDHANP